MADEIREMFPALVEVEQVKPDVRVEALLAVQGQAGPVPDPEATGAFEPTAAEALPATQTSAERYARAIARAEEIDKNETADFDLAAVNLAVAHAKLADFEMSSRQYARAFEGYSRSLAIAERVLRSPRTGEYTESARKGFVARSLGSLGWVTYELGRSAEAVE